MGAFRDANVLNGSQFWKSIQKIKRLFFKGSAFKIGDGCNTSFWGDVWLADCPLRIKYDKLFLGCQGPDVSVANCLLEGMWSIPFKRSLGFEEFMRWENLKNDLLEVELNLNKDSVFWCFEKSGIVLVKSLYRNLTFGGVSSRKFEKLWKSKLPLKVKIFFWLCFHDRIQTLDQLSKRGGKGTISVFSVGLPKLLIMSCLIAVCLSFFGFA